ncbi:MAG: MmcQ/YjbR family DNA-binding protein [Acidobacteriota bacterium]
MNHDDVRRQALALPEATEEDHHGRASYRVRSKIFATVPDDEHLNVMLDADAASAAIAARPAACAELWWGKRLTGVRLSLAEADPELVDDLLTEAWRQRAPKTLARQHFPASDG